MTNPFLAAAVQIARCAGLTLGAERKVILPDSAESNTGWNAGIPTNGTLVPSEVSADKNLTTFRAEMEQSLNNINAVLKEA